MNSTSTRRRRAVAAALATGLVAAVCWAAPVGAGTNRSTTPAGTTADVVELRPLSTKDGRIVDDQGRQILLRGANVNSLGEYWEGVPELPATIAVTDADWDAMAANGFSVVRLLITWSRVEPERGQIDETYLGQIEAHVDAAAARGIYTVVDMHQDAYSAFIFTEDPADCPAGTTPAKGWDGAPKWATLTDGASTCLTDADRNSSPAVTAAWNNFYENKSGIRTQFSKAWAAVAGRLAGRPEIAGFDLINEPDTSAPAAELTPRYEALIRETTVAIRDAQADAPFLHNIIVEPTLPAGHRDNGLIIPDPDRIGLGTDGVIGSVHNYAESIDNGLGLTIEAMNDLILSITGDMGVPNWGGEYGFWSTDDEALEKARRYAIDEDKRFLGGAWWQWRQSCGDPHSVQWVDGKVVAPTEDSVHLNTMSCPDNTDVGPTRPFLDILSRPTPEPPPAPSRPSPATRPRTISPCALRRPPPTSATNSSSGPRPPTRPPIRSRSRASTTWWSPGSPAAGSSPPPSARQAHMTWSSDRGRRRLPLRRPIRRRP